ncbi:MAG: membrane protein insertion efficiency factor YidD [Desulfovibrionaceae bacterium]
MRVLMLFCITVYRRCISPFLPPACRFHPTCSDYARQAITLHGPCKGGLLAAWRLMRCNPLFKGGYDPVPEPTKPILHVPRSE